MRTKLIASFAGVCLITTLYITYRLYDLSSIIPQLSIKTAALDDRISKVEVLGQSNSDEIATIGKFVRAQNKEMEYESLPKYEGENTTEVYKSGKKSNRPAKNKRISSPQNNKSTLTVNRGSSNRNAVISVSNNNTNVAKPASGDPEGDAKTSAHMILNERMHQLKAYAAQNSLDKEYALIADMGISSAKKRFYLIDLNKMAIAKSGLVAYTKKGDNSAKVYRIERTGMEFYELYSLDKNGNVISPEPEILSPVNCVPNAEDDGLSCQSDAGPGISPKLFGEIHQLIKARKKPMLLWMFK
ncbi:MAG: murein L,D-transpeptidase catalytic domain family protein [Chitinophagaceae bacterium]|nr:murein L,D-transpeptidase catalytic domain family protein [Chitinophagaceae bacterium]